MHIILVEDDATCRAVIEASPTQSGIGVTCVATGVMALKLLDAGFRPDLFLTDIQLPGDCDGWLVARIYQVECPNLPVIYLTGSQPPNDQLSNNIYLRKPVSPALLIAVVTALVRLRDEEPSTPRH